MNAVAIIVAAGSGTRFGSEIPKQFQMLGSKPVWRWSYDILDKHPQIKNVIVVLPEGATNIEIGNVNAITGGKTRTESVLSGLNALGGDADTPVLIHDAARPGITSGVIDTLLEAILSADGAAPSLDISDALKRETKGFETIDRDHLFRVQTPQIFRLGQIKSALAGAQEALVDDLEAIQRANGTIKLVPGLRRLEKITRPGDLAFLETLLMSSEMRIGNGFDVHMFEPGEFVTLCGVDISHSAKLKGHSDADAGWHALTDAILGALSLGDIGDHFPPSDPKWKDASSEIFLKHASRLATDRGYVISNADITLICEQPKIKPHREAMRQSTANCLAIAIDRISVKATTTEGLGFTGRNEGIAAQAVVSLKSLSPI